MLRNNEINIAVTGPDKKLPIAWWATRFILWMQGVNAFYITPNKPHTSKKIHAVIIGGGDDIEPIIYGDESNPKYTYDPARDKLEMAVAQKAISANTPILGICRGAQLLNIIAGGSLISNINDLRKHTPKKGKITPCKTINIKKPSLLSRCLGSNCTAVNQLHNQAVKNIGTNLKVTAKDNDGFIQAIEKANTQTHNQDHDKNKKEKEKENSHLAPASKSFLLGVQWHPEYLFYKKCQRNIFKQLIEAAKKSEQLITI